MNERDAEHGVQKILEARGFVCSRFSVSEHKRTKTPDFRVFRESGFCFYTEVKTLRGEAPLDTALSGIDEPQLAVIFRNDPRFNRITTGVHHAVKQFDAVNPDRAHPNVLALMNYDDISNVGDLIALVTGKFIADDGSEHLIYEKHAGGRMARDASRVDLYIWIDDDGQQHYIYNEVSPHQTKLAELFGANLDAMRRV